MTETALQVLRDALRLSPIERAELIDGLLRSFDPNPDQGHRDFWTDEPASTPSRLASSLTTQPKPFSIG
jgi:hypothetical protein